MIACILIPDFVAAVERLRRPVAAGRSLVLLRPSGQVQAASLEAVQQGVRLGMRLRQVQGLCADAQIGAFDPTPYHETVQAISDLLRQFTNRIEVAPGFWQKHKSRRDRQRLHPSAAVLYLDLGRLRDTGELTALAGQLRQRLQERLSANAAVGAARDKFTASAAARLTQASGLKLIPPGSEAGFLSELPITLLPLDSETLRRLRLFGIQTLGQLAQLPPGALVAQFGKTGRLMYQLACGQDTRPVPELQTKPVECLILHLHGPVDDRCVLETILQTLGCDLARRLEASGQAARTLELALHLDDGSVRRDDLALRQPCGDGGQLGRQLIRLLSRLKPSLPVVTVEVQADDLQPVQWRQLDLFGETFTAQDRLRQLLDNLTLRFGDERCYRPALADPNHRLVERRFHMERVEAA